MKCQRCRSRMITDTFFDFQDDTGQLYFYGWRCLNCGEIFDPLIYSNRIQHPAPINRKNRKLIGMSKR